MTNPRQKEGATPVAPSSEPVENSKKSLRRYPPILVGGLSVCLLVAVGRLAYFTPAVQEWRLSQAPLPKLIAERAGRADDSRLLYYIGLRLNQQGRFIDAESNLQRAVGLDPESARLRDEWARALLGTGRVSEAFNQLRQFVGTHPNDAAGHLNLGKFYFTQKSMGRARDEFERAVALAPDTAEAWAYLSQAAGQLAITEVPLTAARRAVALQPKNPGYHLLLAALLVPANQIAEAGREYEQAVEISPENSHAHREYALFLTRYGAAVSSRTTAEAEARRALALDPGDGNANLLVGRLLQEQGKHSEAIAPLTRACELLPEDPAPAQGLTQVFTALNRKADAATWQEEWQKRQRFVTERHALYQKLRVAPGDRTLHRQMARLLGRHGDVEGSIHSYAMALRRPPDSVQTLTAAAHDLTEGGFADRALPIAEQAVIAGKSSPEAHEAYADALLQTGQLDKAIAHYNYTTNYMPHRAAEIQDRVNRYAAAHPQSQTPAEKAHQEAKSLVSGQIGLKRSPSRALELMETACRLDPGNLAYQHFLLDLQFGARKTSAAIATAEAIVKASPSDTRTQALLAILLLETAKNETELAKVEFYLNLVKNSPTAQAQYHYGAGLLALRRKDGPGAVAALKRAIVLDPDADVTFYKLAQAETLAGNASNAAKAMAEYDRRQKAKQVEFGLQGDISQHPDDPAVYQKLARFYEAKGRLGEAKAIQEIIRRRFSTTTPGISQLEEKKQ